MNGYTRHPTPRKRHLKRVVIIAVDHVPERWVPRGLKPACWQARIVEGGPRKFAGTVHESSTREGAVRGMIRRMQQAGYSGNARIVG